MMQVPQPPPVKAVDEATLLMHNARAVHDTARVRLRDFFASGKPRWSVAQVTPSADSGSTVIPGAYIRAETGEFVNPGNSEASTLKNGTLQTIHSASPGAAHAGPYFWTEPLTGRRRILAAEDLYSPFVHGGMVLFRPDELPSASGQQFASPVLIFRDWAGLLPEAFADAQKDRSLLEGAEFPLRLEPLLEHDNGFVQSIVFRELIGAGRLTPDAAAERLKQSKGRLTAVLGYLMLTASTRKSDMAAAAVSRVAAEQDFSKLENLALAAYAARVFNARDASIVRAAGDLARSVEARLPPLGIRPTSALRRMLDESIGARER